ncbi:MAG: bacillithiol biosynthesis cysteine-adding enzyme BshC [Vicinamibacterales bacterium]
MIPQPGVATTASLPVDIRRFPWIRPLAADYAFAYERLESFFSGNPQSPAAWTAAIARAQGVTRQRDRIVDVIAAQQERRGAPAASRAALQTMRDGKTVAVLTGQQAGVFGGPLFTLLKALTAIRLAEQVRREHRVPAVAVFWIDAEDHDWDEVKACSVLDGDLGHHTVSVGNPVGAHERPVARVALDAATDTAIAELERLLTPTEFTPALLAQLRKAYRPGQGTADAFGQWLESVLGDRGLIVYDASDPAAKPLVGHLFTQELEQAGATGRAVAEVGDALRERGYHAQLTPHADSVALFHLDGGREPIRSDGDSFRIGDTRVDKPALLGEVRTHPEAFSPNVMLRPIVQDTLFPTICYVAGPNELAYLGQLKPVYAAFGVPMPLMFQRLTATLVDSNAMRFLTRHEFPIEQLQAQDESALNELLASHLPPGVETSIEQAGRMLRERMEALAAAVPQIDPTLEGATRSTLGRMEDDLKKLHGKVIQAAKRKDETLRRQFQHAQAQAFPAGHPQEREIGFVYFLNKYGPPLIDRLSHELALDMGTHWVVTV